MQHPTESAASAAQALRQRAEEMAQKSALLSSSHVQAMTPLAMQELLHELQVHQIELQMQNEELRGAQLRLDAVRARYFDLYDLAPVGYCTVSEAGLILEANIAAAALLGVTRSSLVGQRISRFIVKSHQDSFYLHRKLAMESGLQHSCELQMFRDDGSTFWIKLSTTAALDSGGEPLQRMVMNDISEAKGLLMVIQQSEHKFRSLLESSPDATIIVDRQGLIVLANARTEAVFAYERAELLGKPVEMLMSQHLHHHHTKLREGFMQRPRTREMGNELVLMGLRKDKTEFPIEVSLSPLQTAQGLLVSCSIRDVTDRKHLHDLLKQQNTELEKAISVADKANQAKSEFLSSMSHELRTPLSAILGFAQLIDSGTPAPTPSQKRSVEHILQAGWYLLELINEILDLALIESGKLSLLTEAISLATIMRECESLIESQAEKRGVRVIFHPMAQNLFVKADHRRMKQIFINLLSNAIKYNKPDGQVDVRCIQLNAGRICINIEDTGQGLSEHEISQLFQPFNRLGQEAQAEQGTGIGLVMTKRLVELMGGVIGVKSTPGQGSTFHIEMDLADSGQTGLDTSASADELLASGISRGQGGVEPARHTLLYVEDNLANLMLVEELIARRPDLRLITARDGGKGIEMTLNELPDVILMDINLPDMSGIEVLKQLLTNPLTARIPVIALSANAIPRDIQKGMQAGFFKYLTKPIKINEFMGALDEALELTKHLHDQRFSP